MRCFGCALRGVVLAVRAERNMRIHLCFAFYVIIAGFVTQLDALSWALVLLCIGAVTALETVNTALERLSDAVTRERHPLVGAAKDCAAGAVLCMAVCAAAVGCVIFFSNGRPAIALQFALTHKITAGLIVLTLLPWLYFIFKSRRSYT